MYGFSTKNGSINFCINQNILSLVNVSDYIKWVKTSLTYGKGREGGISKKTIELYFYLNMQLHFLSERIQTTERGKQMVHLWANIIFLGL